MPCRRLGKLLGKCGGRVGKAWILVLDLPLGLGWGEVEGDGGKTKPCLMQRTDSLEKTLMLGKIEGRRRRG